MEVTYLGFVLDKAVSGELMSLKVTNKTNGKLKLKKKTPKKKHKLCKTKISMQKEEFD